MRPGNLPVAMRAFATAALLLSLGACGGAGDGPARPAPPAPPPALQRIGDIEVRASTVPTRQLAEDVARQYGIAREDGSILLLVSLRRGTEGMGAAVPATVVARATDLGGHVQDIAMRELHVGDLVDYIGTATVAPPDTLRFAVRVRIDDGGSAVLEFGRDFYP